MNILANRTNFLPCSNVAYGAPTLPSRHLTTSYVTNPQQIYHTAPQIRQPQQPQQPQVVVIQVFELTPPVNKLVSTSVVRKGNENIWLSI